MRINVKVQGVESLYKKFTQDALAAQYRADKVTETYARKMANDSAAMAPVKSGDLRANIAASPRRYSLNTWEFGSALPYARRQEYEHASKKGFIRKSVYKNRNDYREALRREITK